MASFDGECQPSYMMVIVMFALSLAVCEIFANLINCQNFDIENEGQCQRDEKWDLRHSTENGRFHLGYFFQNFSYLGTYREISNTVRASVKMRAMTFLDVSIRL